MNSKYTPTIPYNVEKTIKGFGRTPQIPVMKLLADGDITLTRFVFPDGREVSVDDNTELTTEATQDMSVTRVKERKDVEWSQLQTAIDHEGLRVLHASVSLCHDGGNRGSEFIFANLNDFCEILGFQKHHGGGYKNRDKDRIRKRLQKLSQIKVIAEIAHRQNGKMKKYIMEEYLLYIPQTIKGGTIEQFKIGLPDIMKKEISQGQIGWINRDGLKLQSNKYEIYNWICQMFRIKGGVKTKDQKNPQVKNRWMSVSASAIFHPTTGGYKFDRKNPTRSAQTFHDYLASLKDSIPPFLADWTIKDKAGNRLSGDWIKDVTWAGERIEKDLKEVVYWFRCTEQLDAQLKLQWADHTPEDGEE